MTTVSFTFTLSPSTPNDVTGFNVAIVGTTATLTWDPVLDDPDLSHYVIRFTSNLVAPQWSTSGILVNSIPAKNGSAIVASLIGTYLIKAVDIQGYESANATMVSTTIASLDTFNVISTHDEVNFPGTFVNCGTAGGNLIPQGNTARAWDLMSNVGILAYGGSNNLLGITDKAASQSLLGSTVTQSALSGWGTFRVPKGITEGKWYWEVTCTASDLTSNYAVYQMVGVSEEGSNLGFPSSISSHMYYGLTGTSYGNGDYGDTLVGGVSRPWDVLNTGPYVLGVAFDADTGLIEYYLNNEYQGKSTNLIPKNTLVFPTVAMYTNWAGVTQSATINFGETTFVFTAPTGYSSLSNGILPTSYYYFKGNSEVQLVPIDSGIIVSTDGLSIQTSNINWQSAKANRTLSKGKWYWETLVQDPVNTTTPAIVGVRKDIVETITYCGSTLSSYGLCGYNGFVYNNLNIIKTVGTFGSNTDNKILGIALDMDNGMLYFYKNGVYLTEVYIGTTDPVYPMFSIASSGDTFQMESVVYANFGAKGFAFNPPVGFEPLMFPTIDLGVIATSRGMSDNRYIPTNLMNMASGWGTMASISEFSGTAASDASVAIEVSTSLDDVTWSTWAPMIASSFTTRYYKFRAKLTSIHSIDVPLVSAISASIDMPDITQAGNDVVSSNSVDTICTYKFHEAPAIAIAGQNLATGDYFSISNKLTNSFTINFYNSGGTRISRVFDWVAKGF